MRRQIKLNAKVLTDKNLEKKIPINKYNAYNTCTDRLNLYPYVG